MPIVQNKYSHSHFIGEKTEWGGGVKNLSKVSTASGREFEFESNDNMALPWRKKLRDKREQWWEELEGNTLEWRRSRWQL